LSYAVEVNRAFTSVKVMILDATERRWAIGFILVNFMMVISYTAKFSRRHHNESTKMHRVINRKFKHTKKLIHY
jgi:hypothetical protein